MDDNIDNVDNVDIEKNIRKSSKKNKKINTKMISPSGITINADPKKKIEFSNRIMTELIEPSYYDEIKSSMYGRKCWKTTGDVFETLGKVLTGIAAIFAFAAGSFNIGYLSFIAGCINAIGLIFMGFASYSSKESRERTEQVNKILRDLDMKSIVDTTEIEVN